MPKRVLKYNLKNSRPWPAPKRGKARAVLKKPCSKKTTSMKKNLKVPSVRHGLPTKKNKGHRERWGRSIPGFLSTAHQLIQILNQDKLLLSWTGKTCPSCAHGVLGKAEYRKDRDQWIHRCNAKGCQARMAQHVPMKESKICYGCKNGSAWKDVEANEADTGKREVEGQPNKVEWEQWGRLVERGREREA